MIIFKERVVFKLLNDISVRIGYLVPDKSYDCGYRIDYDLVEKERTITVKTSLLLVEYLNKL